LASLGFNEQQKSWFGGEVDCKWLEEKGVAGIRIRCSREASSMCVGGITQLERVGVHLIERVNGVVTTAQLAKRKDRKQIVIFRLL